LRKLRSRDPQNALNFEIPFKKLIRFFLNALPGLDSQLGLAPLFHCEKLQFVGLEEVVRPDTQDLAKTGKQFRIRANLAGFKLLEHGVRDLGADRLGQAAKRVPGHQAGATKPVANSLGKRKGGGCPGRGTGAAICRMVDGGRLFHKEWIF
jgi:hypothetical protein